MVKPRLTYGETYGETGLVSVSRLVMTITRIQLQGNEPYEVACNPVT